MSHRETGLGARRVIFTLILVQQWWSRVCAVPFSAWTQFSAVKVARHHFVLQRVPQISLDNLGSQFSTGTALSAWQGTVLVKVKDCDCAGIGERDESLGITDHTETGPRIFRPRRPVAINMV